MKFKSMIPLLLLLVSSGICYCQTNVGVSHYSLTKTLTVNRNETFTVARIDNNGNESFTLQVSWIPDYNYTGIMDVTVQSVTIKASEKVFLNATFLIRKQGTYTGNMTYTLIGDSSDGNPIDYEMHNKVLISAVEANNPSNIVPYFIILLIASSIVVMLIINRRELKRLKLHGSVS